MWVPQRAPACRAGVTIYLEGWLLIPGGDGFIQASRFARREDSTSLLEGWRLMPSVWAGSVH